jgi:regulator of sigma D
MSDWIEYINASEWALEKLNAATDEIKEYQDKINAAKVAIDEYTNMIIELKKLGYYNSVSSCSRNLMKQADLIVEWQKQIDHIQKYIDELFSLN